MQDLHTAQQTGRLLGSFLGQLSVHAAHPHPNFSPGWKLLEASPASLQMCVGQGLHRPKALCFQALRVPVPPADRLAPGWRVLRGRLPSSRAVSLPAPGSPLPTGHLIPRSLCGLPRQWSGSLGTCRACFHLSFLLWAPGKGNPRCPACRVVSADASVPSSSQELSRNHSSLHDPAHPLGQALAAAL